MANQAVRYEFEVPDEAVRARREAAPRRRPEGRDGALARGLGWFSIGLGVADVIAPGLIARLIGMAENDDNRELLRAAGMREIASGLGILIRRRQAGWVWARVGGDVMDLALLGLASTAEDAKPRRLAVASAAVAGVTALDVICGRRLSNGAGQPEFKSVKQAVTVNRSPGDVYAFWHRFENLPQFMRHLESVRTDGPRRSHWVARGPAGTSFEWDAEIVDDRPGELISWRSEDGADVPTDGMVRFRPAPGGRGTEVVLEFRYRPPAAGLGEAVAYLFGEHPEQQVRDDLRRFKQVVETGEIARSEASESVLGLGRPVQPRPMATYTELARGER